MAMSALFGLAVLSLTSLVLVDAFIPRKGQLDDAGVVPLRTFYKHSKPHCPLGWVIYGLDRCLFPFNKTVTGNQAQDLCRKADASMIWIKSRQDFEYAVAGLNRYPHLVSKGINVHKKGFWINAYSTDDPTERVANVSGRLTPTYVHWLDGEPNGGKAQHCTHVRRENHLSPNFGKRVQGLGMADANCTANRTTDLNYAVCEIRICPAEKFRYLLSINKCVKFVHTPMSWRDGVTLCNQPKYSAHMATILSGGNVIGLLNAISHYATSRPSFWINLHYNVAVHKWASVGIERPYLKWAPGFPRSSSVDDHAVLRHDAMMTNVNPESRHSVFCEIDMRLMCDAIFGADGYKQYNATYLYGVQNCSNSYNKNLQGTLLCDYSNTTRKAIWVNRCKPCPAGRFGLNCARTCSCVHGKCIDGEGTCTCNAGYMGTNCNTACPSGWYGVNCEHRCSCGNGNCNSVNGSCICNAGYMGANCETGCPKGKYGRGCVFSCPCQNGASCDAVSGACTCLPGYYGPICQAQCSRGTYGSPCRSCSCQNGAACDFTNGDCTCTAGYTGAQCSNKCPSGTYGMNCARTCNCVNGDCSSVDGTCRCMAGYMGSKCDIGCPANTFGQDCKSNCTCSANPKDTLSCDPFNGTCTCAPLRSGPRCNQPICSSALKCGPNGKCFSDGTLEFCACKKGWKGATCSIEVFACDPITGANCPKV